jgi:hypothetical protein
LERDRGKETEERDRGERQKTKYIGGETQEVTQRRRERRTEREGTERGGTERGEK